MAPSRASSSRPMSKVAGAKWCHWAIASVAGIRVPRGSATSGATGMASESPWRASAVPRHRVAQGRLDGDGNEVDVGGLGTCFPIQAATDCCDAPAFPKAIQGVFAQARVARLGVGERRRQRAQRLRRSSPRHHVPNLVQEQLYPQIILCEHLSDLRPPATPIRHASGPRPRADEQSSCPAGG